MNKRFGLFPPLVAICLLTTACGFGRRAPIVDPTSAVIEVVNENQHDAQIYRMAEGERAIIGTVPGESRAELETPYPPSGQMSIEVRLVPDGTYRAWAVVVRPHEPVLIEIPADLHLIRARTD